MLQATWQPYNLPKILFKIEITHCTSKLKFKSPQDIRNIDPLITTEMYDLVFKLSLEVNEPSAAGQIHNGNVVINSSVVIAFVVSAALHNCYCLSCVYLCKSLAAYI